MKLNVSKNYGEGKWFKMGDADDSPQFLIRPFPASMENVQGTADGSVILKGASMMDKFVYCLHDWKSIEDQDSNAVKCTAEIKKTIYNYDVEGIKTFVFNKLTELMEERKEDIKN